MKKFNFIIPILNEKENIEKIYNEINNLSIDYEIETIFVDDGSDDNSLSIIKKLSEDKNNVKFISFSKNFGHQIAISAGLDYADGDAVIMLDADFQHPIECIPYMIKKYEQGYDVVQMVKKNQGKRNVFIRFYSLMFYFFFRGFSNLNLSNNVSDFRLISKRVNDQLKKIIEKERFIRGLVQWVGFNYIELKYQPKERIFGKSKYGFFKLLKLASFGIFSFSTVPLKLALFTGFLMSLFSFLFGIFAILKKIFAPEKMPIGYTDIIVFITFIGGIQLIFLGLIGLYISKIFEQVRDRPLYIIKEKKI